MELFQNWKIACYMHMGGKRPLTPFLTRGFRMAAPLAVGSVRRLPTPPLRSPGSAPWLPGFV